MLSIWLLIALSLIGVMNCFSKKILIFREKKSAFLKNCVIFIDINIYDEESVPSRKQTSLKIHSVSKIIVLE